MTILYFFLSYIKVNNNLIQYIELKIVSIKLIKHNVILSQQGIKRSKLVRSFKDSFIITISNALRFLLD